jgi:signal transduction histidine kinase
VDLELASLSQILTSRSEVIAAQWHQAIVSSSFAPFNGSQVRLRLLELTRQVVELLLAEPFDPGSAQAIGSGLVNLHYSQPEALSKTQQTLARELLADLPAVQVVALQSRLSAVLSELAAGFVARTREKILTEQEQIREALAVELLRANEEIRELNRGLAGRIVERTLQLESANQELRNEIVERKRAEEALRQANRDLDLLYRISQTLTATLDLWKVNERLVRAISNTIGAEGSSVWVWDSDQSGLVCLAAFPDPDHNVVNVRLSAGEGVAGWVAHHGESAIVPDCSRDSRYSPAVDDKVGFGIASLLAVPLKLREDVIGVLEAVNKREGDFDARDCALLETLASSAAIAIENARLVEALRQQATELRARNEELDAFSHTVAHDLKNPLHLILGYAEVLEDNGVESREEWRRAARSIIQIGTKMNNILDALLLLAGVRDADVELNPLDMASIIGEVQHRLAYMIWECGAQLILPDASAWLPALGYAPWVEEVWINYLANALQYGGQSPRIELGSEPAPGGERQARFWIRDYGRGIVAQDQARLFTPFTRLAQVHAKGYGLGLSIVRRIVEKLGGQVGVESDGVPGHGALFYFTLPGAE